MKDQRWELEMGSSVEEAKEEETMAKTAGRKEAPTKELGTQELPVVLKVVEEREASIGE